ncbi:hypothetical protein BJY01DRAFT_252540 [Aspergillus pseudoustus]|uniref:Transferase family-domain-containing protein n=1 Tax=Aspergillus pseudoustus TaxID=1810923 RepID=A0ABR4J6L0_9EURO
MASSDQTKYICSSAMSLPFMVNIGLVVDDVLDAPILRAKYAQLVNLWPLLGGRLLSKLDMRRFQCGSTVDFAERTVRKDLAWFLPFSWRPGSSPRIIFDDMASIDEKFLFAASGSSSSTSKLRVTILNDATLLCFSFSHALCDGQSAFDIISCYCDLLSEKPIPKFVLPPDATGKRISDLVRKATTEPLPSQPEQDIFVTNPLTVLKFQAKYLLLRLGELLGLSPVLTHRTVHLPGTWVDDVRSRAQKELEASGEHLGMHLTRNDIIVALYLKLVYGPKKPNNDPVDYIGPINYRDLLEPSSEPDTYYTHNSITFLLCQFSERELQTESITRVAAKIRMATIRYRHPTSIKREISRFEDKVLAPAMQDSRGGVKWGIPMLSPWTTFNYTSLDFSGASRGQARKPAVVFANPSIPLTLGTLPSPMAINQKDGAGGYWLRGANTQSGWEAFERLTSMDSLFCS